MFRLRRTSSPRLAESRGFLAKAFGQLLSLGWGSFQASFGFAAMILLFAPEWSSFGPSSGYRLWPWEQSPWEFLQGLESAGAGIPASAGWLVLALIGLGLWAHLVESLLIPAVLSFGGQEHAEATFLPFLEEALPQIESRLASEEVLLGAARVLPSDEFEKARHPGIPWELVLPFLGQVGWMLNRGFPLDLWDLAWFGVLLGLSTLAWKSAARSGEIPQWFRAKFVFYAFFFLGYSLWCGSMIFSEPGPYQTPPTDAEKLRALLVWVSLLPPLGAYLRVLLHSKVWFLVRTQMGFFALEAKPGDPFRRIELPSKLPRARVQTRWETHLEFGDETGSVWWAGRRKDLEGLARLSKEPLAYPEPTRLWPWQASPGGGSKLRIFLLPVLVVLATGWYGQVRKPDRILLVWKDRGQTSKPLPSWAEAKLEGWLERYPELAPWIAYEAARAKLEELSPREARSWLQRSKELVAQAGRTRGILERELLPKFKAFEVQIRNFRHPRSLGDRFLPASEADCRILVEARNQLQSHHRYWQEPAPQFDLTALLGLRAREPDLLAPALLQVAALQVEAGRKIYTGYYSRDVLEAHARALARAQEILAPFAEHPLVAPWLPQLTRTAYLFDEDRLAATLTRARLEGASVPEDLWTFAKTPRFVRENDPTPALVAFGEIDNPNSKRQGLVRFLSDLPDRSPAKVLGKLSPAEFYSRLETLDPRKHRAELEMLHRLLEANRAIGGVSESFPWSQEGTP